MPTWAATPRVARHGSVRDAEHGAEPGQVTAPRVTPKPEARKTTPEVSTWKRLAKGRKQKQGKR